MLLDSIEVQYLLLTNYKTIMRKAAIYEIISPTNKVYVGQSTNLEKRIRYYKLTDCRFQVKLYNSLRKHGWIAHKFGILIQLKDNVDQSWLNYWEQFFIDHYKQCNFELMNIREAGSKGKLSPETKRKISIANTGKKKSLVDRQGISNRKKKLILNIETGIFYNGISEACKSVSLRYATLRAMLLGYNSNYTNLIYV